VIVADSISHGDLRQNGISTSRVFPAKVVGGQCPVTGLHSPDLISSRLAQWQEHFVERHSALQETGVTASVSCSAVPPHMPRCARRRYFMKPRTICEI
jgi:hypothetical protein